MASEWTPPTSAYELQTFVDLIIAGEFTVDPPFLDLMCLSIAKCSDLDGLRETEDNKKRVDLVSPIFPCIQFRDMLNSIDKVLKKNKTVWTILKTRGDTFKDTGDKEEALRCYTLALSFAPTKAKLAGGFLDRATMLSDMNKYDLAQIDITNTELVYPDEHEPGLYANESLGPNEGPQIQKGQDSVILKRHEAEFWHRGECKGQIMPGVHQIITALPDFVSVQYDPNKGRYLVANKILEAGTIVLMEEPFVSITVDQLNWQVQYCARCLKKTSNPVPCDGCVFCVYCGFECRGEHQKEGHEYECPILPYIHANKLTKSLHLCLKAICKAGPTVLKELYEKSKSKERVEDTWFVPPSNTHGNSNRHSQILNMAYHNRPIDMPFGAWYAVSLAYSLRIRTTFFDMIEQSDTLGFENFIATIIMHHSQCFPYNTMALHATGIEVTSIRSYMECRVPQLFPQVGSGIFPLSNLLNHSCAATTFREHLSGGGIAIITNRKLNPGDQISHSYGLDYLGDAFEKRQHFLSEYFNITCDCIACTENWPMFKDMEPPDIFICETCREHIHDSLNRTCISEIEFDQFKCENCTSANQPNPTNIEMCHPFTYILDFARETIIRNKPEIAITILRECIKYFQKDPRQPNIQVILGQSRLMDSFDLIMDKIIVKEQELVKDKRTCCIV